VLCAGNETRFKYYLSWGFALKGKRNIIKCVSEICSFSLADFSFNLLLRVNQKSSHQSCASRGRFQCPDIINCLYCLRLIRVITRNLSYCIVCDLLTKRMGVGTSERFSTAGNYINHGYKHFVQVGRNISYTSVLKWMRVSNNL